jgi:hypothetical protein
VSERESVECAEAFAQRVERDGADVVVHLPESAEREDGEALADRSRLGMMERRTGAAAGEYLSAFSMRLTSTRSECTKSKRPAAVSSGVVTSVSAPIQRSQARPDTCYADS